ncbi:MAG TPA: succinate dehydrogenase cytochrome b subunit [Ginsengibacter sp.]|nr:succinate dehydrogenase cytochrome b subunit [Ginsengibacter sp.]HRP17797.1 succinate dehydrogenase cytochrome b subunit [Ginsengibacter sp.]HRP45146.1 succinate dehydrogenase cytochrome b subunit [Ginsengibacter sp.]
MTWKQTLTSPVGRKFVMGFTGLFLIAFLIVHAGLNATIFMNDDGATFNAVAGFMSHNWIMRILELGLFIGFAFHIAQGLILWKMNRAARPVKYSMKRYIPKIKWYSRYMGLLGTLVLLYLVMHLAHFWVHTKDELYFGGSEVNLYERMRDIFTQPLWFVLYMVGLASLLFHLLHGFQSAFQSLGMNDKAWTPLVKKAGVAYSVIIVFLFALMPIAFMAGWLQ